MKSKVAIIKTDPRSVLGDIDRLCEMADMEGALDKGSTTILKDNISWHLPMPGANTTPWQLEGTIMALRKRGYGDIVAVENKTVVTRPTFGEKNNKFDVVYDKYGIPVKFNFREEDMKWIRIEPTAKMLVLDKIYPDGIYIPDYFQGKNIIHLPTVKCHIYATTTGSMKNAFGGLLNTNRHMTHSWIHETLVDLLNIQKQIHSGIFAVMDGTTAGNGPGPRTLVPVRTDYILASADQVAIDAVAAKLMGFDPMSLKYIYMAHEQGLGCGRPEDIELAGEDISGVNLHFHVGNNLASSCGNVCWFGPLKGIQNMFFRTPLVHCFIAASDIYHDKYWWPKYGQSIYDKWCKESPWGQLFSDY
ncbi:MAG: DUF362 domain-containing protein [Abditibacteriota bacterium]|nr:DUF362 domain-containing protein [Abditibacteriota bacterium]